MISPPRRILCPVDLSGPSAHALACAVALGRWFGAEVTALHVHQMMILPLMTVGPYAAPALPAVLSSAEREQLETGLARFVETEASPAAGVRATVIEDVNVPATILSHGESIGADLVVIGTKGHSGFERLILGSVAERVLRKATCPVLAVPPRMADAARWTPETLGEVLCPIDFFTSGEAALEHASSWAAKAGAHLTAVHVVEMLPEAPKPPYPEYTALRERLVRDAQHTMERAIPVGIRRNEQFDEQVAVGRPASEILRLADTRNAGLIVMGVRGRGAVDLAVFGSTTQEVVRRASCPVLAVHPESAKAARA